MVDFRQDAKRGKLGRLLGVGAVLAVILLVVLAVTGGGQPDLSPVDPAAEPAADPVADPVAIPAEGG